jgi:hypothetical protein
MARGKKPNLDVDQERDRCPKRAQFVVSNDSPRSAGKVPSRAKADALMLILTIGVSTSLTKEAIATAKGARF